MSSEFDRGVMVKSSWHREEEIREMPNADSMIDCGEATGAWPVTLDCEDLQTASGLPCDVHAIVASYRARQRQVVGVVGDRYRAVTPAAWRDLVRAAALAGAKPQGAFSLRGGSRLIATFKVNGNTHGGRAAGIETNLLLADAFDGSMRLTVGTTSVDVVCANTLAVSLRCDGSGMAQLRHTASLESKIAALSSAIEASIVQGRKVRDTMAAAEDRHLDAKMARMAFDALFPPAPEGAEKAMVTRQENIRTEGLKAANLPINRVGTKPGNLATLWNAATYLVDRNLDGTVRKVRGGEALDSLLFGQRAQRVREVQEVIEVILANGKVEPMRVSHALEAGVDLENVVDFPRL